MHLVLSGEATGISRKETEEMKYSQASLEG